MFFPERRAHVVLCQSVIVTDRRDEKKKKKETRGHRAWVWVCVMTDG